MHNRQDSPELQGCTYKNGNWFSSCQVAGARQAWEKGGPDLAPGRRRLGLFDLAASRRRRQAGAAG